MMNYLTMSIDVWFKDVLYKDVLFEYVWFNMFIRCCCCCI